MAEKLGASDARVPGNKDAHPGVGVGHWLWCRNQAW